ncbi:MAG TPA: PepSY domain-containing protein [Bacteroidetes bacterium]|nr:PepSY domain-containing protein [Bacteroidota bacterium]
MTEAEKSKYYKRRRRIRKLIRYHRHPALVFGIFVLLFAFSGIVLNHRLAFSGISVSRSLLPAGYRYNNWNSGAVKSILPLNDTTLLLYGNVGIWKTDTSFSSFSRFDNGFPATTDERKISTLYKTLDGQLFAGTLFGLYRFDAAVGLWKQVPMPVINPRVYSIAGRDSLLYVMTRNHVLVSDMNHLNFKVINISASDDYHGRIGLFRTLWVIHSGEIFGMPGRLFVDLIALIFTFLTITGLLHWLAPQRMAWHRKKGHSLNKLKNSKRWIKKWHNKLGDGLIAFLIISALTGMFLRPPLLIPIANMDVIRLPFTYLANDNPWFDRFRAMIYDAEKGIFLLGTPDGFYWVDKDFKEKPQRFALQPPISVMGINALVKAKAGGYLVGSFSGLYRWDTENNLVEDYITGNRNVKFDPNAKPIGEVVVSGFWQDEKGRAWYFDFNKGAVPVKHQKAFAKMPENIISDSPMSLWNFMLEVHTMRIFQFLIGDFYVLIIPVAGINILILLIAGYILKQRLYRKPAFWRKGNK